MSVVVRMEMPEGCWDCPCVNGEYGYCQAYKEYRQIEDPNERPSWCPIICSLPEVHGRLIDERNIFIPCDVCDGHEAMGFVEETPTIVPAAAERSET